MSGRLNGRVSRLEDGREEPCEECGFDGDESKVEHVVEWVNPEEVGPEDSTWCETCGRALKIVVSFEDPNDPWRSA